MIDYQLNSFVCCNTLIKLDVMKMFVLNSFRYFILIIVLLSVSCKKDEIDINTTPISDISSTAAVSGGTVLNEGGSSVSSKGICWATHENPTTSDFFTLDGSGTGSYNSYLTKLRPSTLYYVRSYATNSNGTKYGNQYSFRTTPLASSTVPIVYYYDPLVIDSNNFKLKLNAEVMHVGLNGKGVVSERGFVWSFKMGPSISNDKIQCGNGMGVFNSEFNYQTDQSYYFRAYAINESGVAYSDEFKVLIEKAKPRVQTLEVYDIDSTSATANVKVLSSGGTTIISKGVCWSTQPYPTVEEGKTINGEGLGDFTSSLKDLKEKTTYYCRSYVTNSQGVFYGNELKFTTYPSELQIGMRYKGGIIFFLDQYKKGGLVVSEDDLGYDVWGCDGVNIPTDNPINEFDGSKNSINILGSCPSAAAAKLCYDYKVGKFDDWYLPSFYELTTVYNNIKVKDFDRFSPGYYWSSSVKDKLNAYTLGFIGGNQGVFSKSSKYFVRAIRKI